MKWIRLAGSTVNQTPLDWKGNENRILQVIKEAHKQQVDILCLPELCISGYGCEDAFFNEFVTETAWQVLERLLIHTKKMVVSFGLPIRHHGVLYNAVAVVVDGTVRGIVPKKSLAGDGVHYEHRWFKAWPNEKVDRWLAPDGTHIPFGDLHFNVGDVKIGLEICEEAWVAHRPGAALARLGVEVILNPSASHFAFQKFQVRKSFVTEGSRAFNVAYVYTNLMGNEGGRILYDGGVLIAKEGQLLAQGPRLSFKEWTLLAADVDLSTIHIQRMRTHSYEPFIDRNVDACVRTTYQWNHTAEHLGTKTPVVPVPTLPWEHLDPDTLKKEEFTRAVALALYDFMRKSRQKGFVISLSGGVDSSACAILSSLAFELSLKELGESEWKARWMGMGPQFKDLHTLNLKQNPRAICKSLITCVYQSTKNSSALTFQAAEELAAELGCEFLHWDVEPLVQSYIKLVEDPMQVKLDWQKDDLTLQNIQARVRGPGVWMVANIKRFLLITTSNRSESAVGYATMDGDTCGGLAPLGGIDKAFLMEWSRWIHEVGLMGLSPIVSLKNVLNHPPTAELRPSSMSQTDEKDLMPYTVLNSIEKLAIRDKRSPVEIFQVLRHKVFTLGLSEPVEDAQLKKWIELFFKLWAQNQWKRERYAPSFHLDDESLDPKTWCRFPILSSQFEEELQSLKDI